MPGRTTARHRTKSSLILPGRLNSFDLTSRGALDERRRFSGGRREAQPLPLASTRPPVALLRISLSEGATIPGLERTPVRRVIW